MIHSQAVCFSNNVLLFVHDHDQFIETQIACILHYPYNLIKSVAYQTFILVKSSISSLKQKQQLKTKTMQTTKHKNLNIESFVRHIKKLVIIRSIDDVTYYVSPVLLLHHIRFVMFQSYILIAKNIADCCIFVSS